MTLRSDGPDHASCSSVSKWMGNCLLVSTEKSLYFYFYLLQIITNSTYCGIR